MKRTLLMLLMAGATIGAMAQNVREVKGTVIDKNGNPLPGAKIEATGGAENTVTDADGTFSMEVPRYLKSLTATYPGMRTKKLKIENNNDLLFEMRKGSKNHWFINAMMAHGFSLADNKAYIGEGGLMFGQYIGNKWGWFAKAMVGTGPDMCHICPPNSSETVGALRHIAKSLYGYVGFGFGTGVEHNHSNDEWLPGLAIDGGLMLRLKQHFNVVFGFSAQGLSTDREDDYNITNGYDYSWQECWRLSLQLGVGYTF